MPMPISDDIEARNHQNAASQMAMNVNRYTSSCNFSKKTKISHQLVANQRPIQLEQNTFMGIFGYRYHVYGK